MRSINAGVSDHPDGDSVKFVHVVMLVAMPPPRGAGWLAVANAHPSHEYARGRGSRPQRLQCSSLRDKHCSPFSRPANGHLPRRLPGMTGSSWMCTAPADRVRSSAQREPSTREIGYAELGRSVCAGRGVRPVVESGLLSVPRGVFASFSFFFGETGSLETAVEGDTDVALVGVRLGEETDPGTGESDRAADQVLMGVGHALSRSPTPRRTRQDNCRCKR